MIRQQQSLTIPIDSRWGEIQLFIEPNADRDELFIEDETWPGESKYHLQEGCCYQYELTGGQEGHAYQLRIKPEIVSHRNGDRHRAEGTLSTGIYVGTLRLQVYDLDTDRDVGTVELEIRSVKTNYQTDYRTMLNDIASYYTDLVLQQGAPVTQKLEVDDTMSYTTLYQKFSFIRSVIESDAFGEAIHKIFSNPVRKWTDTVVQKNIVSVKRLSRQNLRQMAASADRVPLPAGLRGRMPAQLSSVPRHLTVSYKEDTVDNQENQFVKFALRSFLMFCSELRTKKNCTNPLKAEIDHTSDILNSYLDNQFFRLVSMPSHFNLNSPVLQRKEGYREVLQAWLLFDLAAKLSWKGGDDIYDAGKKNVAVLYEYWLFFKLMELVGELFNISTADKKDLVKSDADGINLNLKQGKMTMIKGKHESFNRTLNIALYYNRTFGKVAEDQDPIHKAGSWTMKMRPDYTLSIWPGAMDEDKAEAQELITHIHFDAKYRLNKILLEDSPSKIEEDGDDALTEEKNEQERGIYKRADLLKMHAYKDAIRRTSGAYVLYPGTTNRKIKGFHEIIPGLGAFSIRPGHFQEDAEELKCFLREVKIHMADRISQREKMSLHSYETYLEPPIRSVRDNLPESIGENRSFMPDKIDVLLGYVKSLDHLNWIIGKDNLRYNARAGKRKGTVSINTRIAGAQYILLHQSNGECLFFKLAKGGPQVYDAKALKTIGYPFKEDEYEEDNIYLMFRLNMWTKDEFDFSRYTWNSKDIEMLHGKGKFRLQTIKLSDLMKCAEEK